MNLARATIAAAALVVVSLGLWAFWIEPASLRPRQQDLALPTWPQACAGLTVAVLADLHVGSPHNGLSNLEKVVAITNAAKPDLVLLAGDYVIQDVVGGHFETPEAAAEVLRNLRAPLGVFAVLGNHDWWLDPVRVQSALESQGIAVLEDRATEIHFQACSFWLAGISDFWEGPHDVEKALVAVPPGATTLAFTHNPDVFPQIPDHVNLTIAGHTHGGQVYFPGIGRPIVPSRFGERFAIGHIEENGRHLFVSSGIGTSILPVRFLVPPEVTVLTLGSASNAALRKNAQASL